MSDSRGPSPPRAGLPARASPWSPRFAYRALSLRRPSAPPVALAFTEWL